MQDDFMRVLVGTNVFMCLHIYFTLTYLDYLNRKGKMCTAKMFTKRR